MEERTCQQCGATFATKRSAVLRGGGLFCSKPCHAAFRTLPIKERFWTKVQQGAPNACWPFTGYINKGGYGHIKVMVGADEVSLAHRMAYQLMWGDIPEGHVVDHRCHSALCEERGAACPHRRCCNPRHLKVIPYRENFLRSNHPNAITADPGICRQGHPFTPENTYIEHTRGGKYTVRRCRTCKLAKTHAAYIKRTKPAHAA